MLSRRLLGERQIFLWWGVFVTPFAASTLEWAILSSRRCDQLRHVTVILATLGAFAALTWVVIEKNWLSWMALAISGWMFGVWMLMMLSGD
jgi:hypothetical protein